MNKVLNIIKENKFLVLILLVASILRFYKLNFQSLWLDEIYTMNITNPINSFANIITEVNSREGFPYLYFILIKIFYFIFGYSPIVTRGFSAIMGIASVYAIYLLAKELYGKNVGLYAALLLTFSEYCIAESQDARPYSFYMFSVIMTFYSLVVFIKKYSLKNAIQYGVFAGLLINVNFFGFINLFSQAIIVFFFLCIIPKNERIIYFKRVFISGLIALVMFLPNVYKFSTLIGFKSTWIPAPTGESFTFLFREFLGNSEMTLFLFMPLFLFFLITNFKEKNTVSYEDVLERKNVFSFIILIFWIFILITVLFLKSYLDTPLIITRYFTSIVPVFYIVFASSITMISNKIIRFTVLICLISFMWINHDIVRKYYDIPNKTQFREASQIIIDNNKNNEQVYTSLKYWFDYYLNNENTKFSVTELPLDIVINEMRTDSTKIRSFWYTNAHGNPYKVNDELQLFINKHFYIDKNFDGRDAWTKHFQVDKGELQKYDISKFKVLQSQNGNSIRYWVEFFEKKEIGFRFDGWAYLENQDAVNSEITVLLIKDLMAYKIRTTNINRPDITNSVNGVNNLDNSGFISTINLEKIPSGNYKVGILIKNSNTGTEGLVLTDKTVQK